MPSLEENLTYWQSSYDWAGAGDEWSERWGGSEGLWRETLLPRIGRFLPAGTVLEIAPGFGRWSRFLKQHCDRLVLVDLAERCIEACRERFAGDSHIEYHVSDGRSLAAVADGSVDFAFSFDSLVHVENDVLYAYVEELARVLAPEGAAFIHHSNLGRFAGLARWVRRMPMKLQYVLNRHLINLSGWRCEDGTAEGFRAACARAGLSCIEQESVPWLYGRKPIDTLSILTRPGSPHDAPHRSWNNRRFMQEAERALASRPATGA